MVLSDERVSVTPCIEQFLVISVYWPPCASYDFYEYALFKISNSHKQLFSVETFTCIEGSCVTSNFKSYSSYIFKNMKPCYALITNENLKENVFIRAYSSA